MALPIFEMLGILLDLAETGWKIKQMLVQTHTEKTSFHILGSYSKN